MFFLYYNEGKFFSVFYSGGNVYVGLKEVVNFFIVVVYISVFVNVSFL